LNFFNKLCGTTVGIYNQTNFENKVNIFPNSFVNIINITVALESEKFTLTSVMGQTVWKGNKIEWQDFLYLTKGIYFLTISNQKSFETVKLIKE